MIRLPLPRARRGRRGHRVAVVLLTGFALATPAWGQGGRAATTATPPADPRFDEIVALARERLATYRVAGAAIGILHDGQVRLAGVGITNVADSLPVTTHTVFPLASISKTFTATVVMRLVEAGKLDLDVPVQRYLPEFRVRDSVASRTVTMRHLLTHRGGWEGQIAVIDRGSESLREFVAGLTDLMQIAPPGEAWSYNNAGFSIAGRVIERVTGVGIHDVMRASVFGPLGLMHAGTTAGDFITHRFAVGHGTVNGEMVRQSPFVASVGVVAGGTGMCIADLMTYAQLHLGNGTNAFGEAVLSPASVQAMRTPQARKQSTDDEIGLAWHIRTMNGVRTYSHGGTLAGHNLLLELVPERGFAIAILTNSNVGWRLIQDVERAALQRFAGLTYARNQAIAHRGVVETLPDVVPLAPQPDPAPYVGGYRRPSSRVEVRVEQDTVVVEERTGSSTRGRRMPIRFFAPDRAVVVSGSDQGQSIEFVRDAAGLVKWVRVVGRVSVRE